MKKLVLISVAMFALSVCAADKIGFCIGKDANGKLGYVQSDYNNMKTKTADTTLESCVKQRYEKLSSYVSTVLNKTCSDVRAVVKSYCDGKAVKKPYSVESFTYKGTPFKNALVLHTTDAPANCPATGTSVNNPGDRWFFGKEECPTVDFSI